jgi:uncharacterized membrane protein YphA (DoxX/SURF4 family)
MHMIFIRLLAAAFASAGLFNAIATSTTRSNFVRWGYPAWWCRVTGGLEISAAILVAIPATRAAGLILCAVILAAAALTMLRHREFSQSRTDRLLCCVAANGESDFLKDWWLPGTSGSCRSAWNAEGERVPLGCNRRIARIFLDAAHDDLERPVRKQPLQLRSLKSDCDRSNGILSLLARQL